MFRVVFVPSTGFFSIYVFLQPVKTLYFVFVPSTGFFSIYSFTGSSVFVSSGFRPLNGVLFYLPFPLPKRFTVSAGFRPLNGVLFYLPCLSQPPESRVFQTDLRRKPDSFAESFQKIHIFFKTLYFMGCGAKYCFRLVGMSYIPYPYHTIFPRILYTYIREVLFSSQYPLHVYAFYRNFPTYFYKYYR